MADQLERLRDYLARSGNDAVFISQTENRRYLSGFTGAAGFLLISQDRAILATDFRYIEQARMEAPAFEIVRIQGTISSWFPPLLADLDIRKLGFEGRDISCSTFKDLTAAIHNMDKKVSLELTEGVVESLRAIKYATELNRIREAAMLAESALSEVLPALQPGISEKELAWKLESFLRQKGSESLPFEIIVASGPNSALPHARPSDRVIQRNEPVIIDLGSRIGGYCSDMTRTTLLGEGDSTFHRIYDIVLGAQQTAMTTLQAGMKGEQVDQLARTVIVMAGYEEKFGHGLGHGVGLAIHEEPRIGPGSSDVLANGMVFTIEPGIYIEGWGGIRIEDMVVLDEGKAKPLTTVQKTWRGK